MSGLFIEPLAQQLFNEQIHTTTLHLKRVTRRVLARSIATRVDAGGARIRVKTADRPDGTTTAKADMDDIAAAAGDRAAREALRRRIEDTHGTEDGR